MKAALTLITVLGIVSALPAHAAPPGGGWDLNDAKLSVSHGSKLLTPIETPKVCPGDGGDVNNAQLPVSNERKLLSVAK